MSNARYFADGTDFYRVLYDDGSTEGPYISVASARRVGSSGIRIHESHRWSRVDGVDVKIDHTWQNHESYIIQKLVPAKLKCNETREDCFPRTGFCFGEHGYTLKWEYI